MYAFTLLLFTCTLASAEVVLSPQKVVDIVSKNSDELKVLKQNRLAQQVFWQRELSKYSYTFELNTAFQLTKAESFDGFANEEDKRLQYSLGLHKKLRSGTDLKLIYDKTSVNTIFNTFNLSRSIPDSQYKDELSFELEQALWRNQFGEADKLRYSIASEERDLYQLELLESVEEEILRSMTLFWKTYVSKRNFDEAIESRERYRKLVKTVQRKSKLGYTGPGELSRTLAELEVQEQRVKLNSLAYLELIDQLKAYLKLSSSSELRFSIETEIPKLPVFIFPQIESLRSLRLASSKSTHAQMRLEAENSLKKPELNLVARVRSTGLETNSEDSLEELGAFSKPSYYLGLRLRFQFGEADTGSEAVYAQRMAMLSDLKQKMVQRDLKQGLTSLENKVKSYFLVVTSAEKLVGLRQQSTKEIEKAYQQGRLDIQELIDTYNALSDAKVQKISSVGDYHMSLNELAALKDELVKQ